MSKVFALKLIRKLFTTSGSLWVSWVKEKLWSNDSLWDIRESAKGSWVWRKLLRLRPLAAQFIRMQIKNGQITLFWSDPWLPGGRLIDIVGDSGPQRLDIGRYTKVADAANASGWQIRRCRDQTLQQIITSVRSFKALVVGNEEDMVLWKSGSDEYKCRFSSFQTWEQIQPHREKQNRSKLVWFVQGSPRFAFITWLAIRDTLATGVRMRQWEVVQVCVFCGEPNESRDHLFFACPYTFTVWLAVVGDLLGVNADPNWEMTLNRLVEHDYDKLTFILLRLVFQTSIYYLWKKRNDRRHTGKLKLDGQLTTLIEKMVRNRIMSTRYFEKPRLLGLMQRWFKRH